MNIQRTLLAAFAAIVALPFPARADVKLPAVISDHMVLQRDAAAPIWGWADAGEEVTVRIADQEHKAKPDAGGKWMVRLNKLTAGGPHTLTIQGKNTITVKDVLVGEVWLGSGQSNMAMTVNRCLNAEDEKKTADRPTLRMFTEKSTANKDPQTVGSGAWVICTPDSLFGFSATLYFFGREIHSTLNVPVGLINSSVGGTPIESWIDGDTQRATPELKPFVDSATALDAKFDPAAAKAQYEKQLAAWKVAAAKAKADGKPVPKAPTDPIATRARKGNIGGLFNGKINPLIPYAIRGAIWYQGEANSTTEKAPFYKHQLPLLVTDWRKRWGQGDFPFAWVQLPNFDGAGRDWPIVREGMRETLKLPNTGMAITIDIGEAKDIHPKNKQDVGKRLAAWALATVYGQKMVASGPLPLAASVSSNEVKVSFAHADGLTAKGGEPTGFEVSADGSKWVPAKARIDGSAVIVSSADVASPKAVRYAWANNPVCNVYNAAGIPMSPFTKDVGK